MAEHDPYDPMIARNRLALLHRFGTPDPDEARAARAQLVAAKIGRAIRDAASKADGALLNSAQVRYLVGLILAEAGLQYELVTVLESQIGAVVEQVQDATEAAQSKAIADA